jgi:gliding motility-associated-like protein
MAGNVESGYYLNQVYQWQFNDGVNGWVNIPGAVTPDYTIPNAQTTNSGTYRLLVAESVNINSANCRSVSPLIPINVYAPVVPVLQSNQPVCEKDTLRISTSTNALRYLWKKGPTTFPSATNTLSIPNSLISDAGTYSLDVITNGGCSSFSSITVAVQANQFVRMLPPNTLLCDEQTLDVDAQQPLATSYLWNDGSTSPQRIISNAGTYSLITSDAVCKRTDSFDITRNFTPTVELGNDSILCYNELTTLNAAHPLAEAYLWSTGSTDSSITVNTAGVYSVAVGNQCGVAVEDIAIDYKDCADIIFVPNAFTPNDDRLNDVLYAKAYFRIEEINFKIYNRWGQLIFTSTSLINGWNGKINSQKAPPGMYIWTVQYKRNGKVYNQKGTVLVIY